MLSRVAARSDKFPNCPINKISFEDRKELIVQEINSFVADFICLEEVDYRDSDYLVEKCGNKKYGSYYLKKNITPDGILILYNKRFTHLESSPVLHYNNKAKNELANQKSMINVFLHKKDNSTFILIVGVSHFRSGPFYRGDRRS